MQAFWAGVVSSLVASGLLLGLSWLSPRARAAIARFVAGMNGAGVEHTYETQSAASRDIARELQRARWVKILASRGNELTRDTFSLLTARRGGSLDSIQILLPDPGQDGAESWLQEREREVSRFDPGISNGLLGSSIRNNIRYIVDRADRAERLDLRVADFPHVARIVATNRYLFLTVYNSHGHGRDSPCVKIQAGSVLADMALRFFALHWDKSTSPALGGSDTPS